MGVRDDQISVEEREPDDIERSTLLKRNYFIRDKTCQKFVISNGSLIIKSSQVKSRCNVVGHHNEMICFFFFGN